MSTQHHLAAFDPEEVAGAKILIVETGFNPELVAALRRGAEAVLDAAGATHDVVTVPGALEVPAAVSFALRAEEKRGQHWDGYVTLGCVIRGETFHFEIVSMESARALMDLSVESRLALGNGILTVETEEQAWERADPARLDKGGAAAAAALAMVALRRRFGL